jgi:hypothetical protein
VPRHGRGKVPCPRTRLPWGPESVLPLLRDRPGQSLSDSPPEAEECSTPPHHTARGLTESAFPFSCPFRAH